jgi:hypothetical protein
MKFQITGRGWLLSGVLAPAGTIIDAKGTDRWSLAARGKGIPLNATPLDEEAWQAQPAAYPDQKHLLGGGLF